jgi:hypothetical protein
MKRVRLVVSAAVATALIAGSLLAGTGSAEVVSLPSLTPELLLDIARVDAPPAGIGLQVHADFPAEHPLELDGLEIYSLTADITPDGTILTRSVLTQTELASAGPGVGECDDPSFVPTGVTWRGDAMPILWRFDRRSTPTDLKADKTLLTVRSAHRVWPQAQSTCADRDHYSFAYNYLGHTSKNPKYDQVNIVDFGELGQGSLAVNSTWYSSTNKILEVDLRLNKVDYKWSNVEGVNLYQVRNVVAHELGHQIGLDDLGTPHEGLTMFGKIGTGEMKKVTLGRGDLRGADTLSP